MANNSLENNLKPPKKRYLLSGEFQSDHNTSAIESRDFKTQDACSALLELAEVCTAALPEHQEEMMMKEHQGELLKEDQELMKEHQGELMKEHQGELMKEHQLELMKEHQEAMMMEQHQEEVMKQHQEEMIMKQHQEEMIMKQHQEEMIMNQHQDEIIMKHHHEEMMMKQHQEEIMMKQHQEEIMMKQHQEEIMRNQHQEGIMNTYSTNSEVYLPAYEYPANNFLLGSADRYISEITDNFPHFEVPDTTYTSLNLYAEGQQIEPLDLCKSNKRTHSVDNLNESHAHKENSTYFKTSHQQLIDHYVDKFLCNPSTPNKVYSPNHLSPECFTSFSTKSTGDKTEQARVTHSAFTLSAAIESAVDRAYSKDYIKPQSNTASHSNVVLDYMNKLNTECHNAYKNVHHTVGKAYDPPHTKRKNNCSNLSIHKQKKRSKVAVCGSESFDKSHFNNICPTSGSGIDTFSLSCKSETQNQTISDFLHTSGEKMNFSFTKGQISNEFASASDIQPIYHQDRHEVKNKNTFVKAKSINRKYSRSKQIANDMHFDLSASTSDASLFENKQSTSVCVNSFLSDNSNMNHLAAKKSERVCKGKRYQELITEGFLQKTKERKLKIDTKTPPGSIPQDLTGFSFENQNFDRKAEKSSCASQFNNNDDLPLDRALMWSSIDEYRDENKIKDEHNYHNLNETLLEGASYEIAPIARINERLTSTSDTYIESNYDVGNEFSSSSKVDVLENNNKKNLPDELDFESEMKNKLSKEL